MTKKVTVPPWDDKTNRGAGLDFITDSRANLPAGVKLSDIYQVELKDLKDNPANILLFSRESKDYFDRLTADIKERGILVPLLARRDGVILAGHNRLIIAQALGLARVPIQYILSPLDEIQERAFMIKDNLFRRQLTAREKEALILKLYGDEIEQERRGGDRKSEKIKRSTEPLIGTGDLSKRIETETGIKAGTAKRIIAKARKERQGKQTKPEAAPDPLRGVRAQLGKIIKLLDGADRKTIDAAIIEIIDTLDFFGIDPRYSPQLKKIKENMKG